MKNKGVKLMHVAKYVFRAAHAPADRVFRVAGAPASRMFVGRAFVEAWKANRLTGLEFVERDCV